MFPIHLTPSIALAGALVLGVIAALITAGIIGARKNARRYPVNYELAEPYTGGDFNADAQIDAIADALTPERHVGKHPALAMGFSGRQFLAEAQHDHPDVYAAVSAALGLTDSQITGLPTDLPEGVYWSIDAQNFYGPDGRAMDQHFAEVWWPRMLEFPQQ
jgi:hypothetical protein